MKHPSHKGSGFERYICKLLSQWWTKGERDDVFWRASTSGGRATIRGRKGKKTFGGYGDVTAMDPAGTPLLEVFTIEAKRGYFHAHIAELFDHKPRRKPGPFACFVQQAINAHKADGSKGWMLIHQRDKCEAMVYFPYSLWKELGGVPTCPLLHLRCMLANEIVSFVGMRFGDFCMTVTPSQVKELV